jgi:hypothetical protein
LTRVVTHACPLILDWRAKTKARDERLAPFVIGWLAGVQEDNEITTRIPAEAA